MLTPIAPAWFSHVQAPDTRFGKENAKFKSGIVLTEQEAKAFVGGANAAWESAVERGLKNEKAKAQHIKKFEKLRTADLMDEILKPHTDKEGNETGSYILEAKSKNQPKVVDSKKNPYTGEIYLGDMVRLSVGFNPWVVGANCGIAVYLNAVQLVERKTRSGAVDDFPEEDGFVVETADAEESEQF